MKEPYVPCVTHFPEAGISEFVQEDVAIVWKWLGDGVQAGYAMDDDRLVGVQWPIASRPAPADAVRILVEALEIASNEIELETPSDAIPAIQTALSDPRVIAAQSADPWLPIASAEPEIMTEATHPGALGLGWKLSAEAQAALDAIDASQRAAAVQFAHLIVGAAAPSLQRQEAGQ